MDMFDIVAVSFIFGYLTREFLQFLIKNEETKNKKL